MGSLELDRMTWPEISAEIAAGRDTVVMALGATEQHGPHMALATDAVIGDQLAALVADRLDAFLAPTVRVGCSRHHLAFAGTMSLQEQTFHALVADIVRSFAGAGFGRVVLLPTHGGNFGALAVAVEKLGQLDGTRVVAMTDLGALLEVAMLGQDAFGVPLTDGGLHAGEWETSMLLAIRPDLVHMDRAEAGYTGDLQAALGSLFEQGVDAVAANGVIGNPEQASAEHGERYWQRAVELVVERVSAAG
jgi:creatinine amidohydrolase/Fe(II)-dependent formamide hydrolase-like protein